MFENYRINLYKSSYDNLAIIPFVSQYHYLGKSMPRGCNKWYVLLIDNKIRGVAAFGIPAGRNCRAKYGQETLELRRFVLHPDMPKNSGSWFMSKCLNQLKEHNILSYSDPTAGHTGHLYKACNYFWLEKQRCGSTRVKVGDRILFAQSESAKRIKNKQLIFMPRKDIWFYPARNKKVDVTGLIKHYGKMKRTSCVDLETGVIYKSVYAASKNTGFDMASIRNHLNGKLVYKKARFINYEKA